MLNFLCFFVLFNAMKTDTKLTLHHTGKIFIIYLVKIKFKTWRVTFLKSFLPLTKFGMVFRFSRKRQFTMCTQSFIVYLGRTGLLVVQLGRTLDVLVHNWIGLDVLVYSWVGLDVLVYSW